MDIKLHFYLKKQHNTPYEYTMYCTFVQPSLEARNSLKYDGLPGVLGNKGTKGKHRREQENMTPGLGNAGT